MGRRALMHAAAWLIATSAAVTLSWFGVHTVLAGTEYDPPRSLPISGESTSTTSPGSRSPQQPEPSPSHSSDAPAPPRTADPTGPAPPAGHGSGGASSAPPYGDSGDSGTARSGNVNGASVPGGRAVFDMHDDYAALVSATPDDGWDTQVWKDATWIRVTFSSPSQHSTIFCRWDDGPPRIETYPGG